MVFRDSKWGVALLLVGTVLATPQSHAALKSVCRETTVGRPLDGFQLPEKSKTSNDIIATLGPPFYATYDQPSKKDVLVYVDGFFHGMKGVTKSTDPALGDLHSASRRSCGVALVFTFTEGNLVSWEATALNVDDLTKAHASKFADTTWATLVK